MNMRFASTLAGLIFCLNASALLAQPTTRPGQGAVRGEMLIQRVRGAMADLNLSDEQKAKINDVFAGAKQDMQQMAGELQNMGQQERAQRVREFMQNLREKISVELNDDQKKLLEEKIQQMRAAVGAGGAGPATQPGDTPAGGRPGDQRPMALLKRLEDS